MKKKHTVKNRKTPLSEIKGSVSKGKYQSFTQTKSKSK